MTQFKNIADAADAYRVFYGTFSFDEDLLPPDPMPDPPLPVPPVPARFVGKQLTHDGFTADVTGDVTIQFTCAGPWCGTLVSDVLTVAFIPADWVNHELNIGYCDRNIFVNPSSQDIDKLASCVTSDTCMSID